MLKGINRNNRLFMLANFLFALSYGLWLNLRQLHLADLGAAPAETGTVFALAAIAGGVLPIPAGILADRIGPRRVVIGAWLIAMVGTTVAALAPSWPWAGVGYVIFMLCIAANPATVSFVLLNTRGEDRHGTAEGVLATVFASWPAAMVFAPALGGAIADRWGMAVVHGVGAVGFLLAIAALLVADDVRSGIPGQAGYGRILARNRAFVALAVVYPLLIVALHMGYVLAPTFLGDRRGFSNSEIGLLFSIFSVGTLAFRTVLMRLRPRPSFAILMAVIWLGTLILWQASSVLSNAAAFLGLGAISTLWILLVARVGQTVSDRERGLALGVTETLSYGAIALASWLAGHLYEHTPAHDLPIIAGLIAIPVVTVLWMSLPFERWSEASVRGAGAAALSDERAG